MAKENLKILFIESCDYIDYPIGGYLSFAKQMITAFGNQLSIVGISTDDTPVGVWVKKEINGVIFDFFSVKKVIKTEKKTFIPQRLKSYLAIRKYQKKILSIGIKNIFIQTPEVLFALNNSSLINLCIRIPGVENPLSISRYWYGKYFAKLFDYFYFRSLKTSKLIIASADELAINEFKKRSKNVLNKTKVIQFPTCINTDIFRPNKKEETRVKLGINLTQIVITTTGRLNALKGWKFMLKSFIKFKENYPDSLFIFLGDGEDRSKIEEYIASSNITQNVLLAGRLSHEDLSLYLNSADVFVMGSYFEGWATSLVEAIACGKPVVCTNFSSAKELVKNGYNGFIIESHDIDLFAESMSRCFQIPSVNLTSKSLEMQQYASSSLKESILEYWNLV